MACAGSPYTATGINERKAMSSTESPISITVRTPAGTLVTVRADGGEQLDSLVANSIGSLASAVTELEAIMKSSQGNTMSPGQIAKQLNAAVVSKETIPSGSNVPQIGGGRSCKHGKMTALQGPSKEGGIYKGYFCPTPQGSTDKCKNIYIQKNDPEWNTFIPDRIK